MENTHGGVTGQPTDRRLFAPFTTTLVEIRLAIT